MKRILTVLFFSAFVFHSMGQSGVGNLDFENWGETGPLGDPQPSGFASIGQTPNTTDPFHGDTALKIETTQLVNGDIVGLSVTGEIILSTQEVNVGEPYPHGDCPDSLVGYIRYSLPNSDTATIFAQVWNASNSNLASAQAKYGAGVGTWTKFKIDFQPMDCGGMTADSIGILFTSETVGINQYVPQISDKGTETVGGTFEVDSVTLYEDGNAMDIKELTQDERTQKFSAYPNPAENRVHFAFGRNSERIRIFDMTGRNVRTIGLNGSGKSVDVSELKEGLYIYRVEDASGKELHTDKLQLLR